MSGIGFSELLILFLIGLIVLGPEKLPRVANQLGSWLGQARRMTRVMKRQLEEELNVDDINQIASPEQLLSAPDPKKAPDPADPAYDDSEHRRLDITCKHPVTVKNTRAARAPRPRPRGKFSTFFELPINTIANVAPRPKPACAAPSTTRACFGTIPPV